MIKNNHEYKYQLFVEMWEDDYTVAEIAKRLHLREFTVAGKNFVGRYYEEHPHVKPGRINVDRMMALVHEIENRYGKLTDEIPEDDRQLMKLRKVVHANN